MLKKIILNRKKTRISSVQSGKKTKSIATPSAANLAPRRGAPRPTLPHHSQISTPRRPTLQLPLSFISLLYIVTNLLVDNPSKLQFFSLDFSKALVSVRHSAVLEKMIQRDISEKEYTAMVNFFNATHTHYCNRCHDYANSS